VDRVKQGHSLDRYKRRNPIIFLWFGTCDLTKKTQEGFAELNREDNSIVEKLTETYREIVGYLHREGFKPIILETPYYSIQFWNSLKGHTNPEIFKHSDE